MGITTLFEKQGRKFAVCEKIAPKDVYYTKRAAGDFFWVRICNRHTFIQIIEPKNEKLAYIKINQNIDRLAFGLNGRNLYFYNLI